MISLRIALGQAIARLRKEAGHSQEGFAALCGVHRTYVGSVERRERNVTLATLELFAKTMECSVPELLSSRKWK